MGENGGITAYREDKNGGNRLNVENRRNPGEQQVIDYRKYAFSVKERMLVAAEYGLISGGFAYLFYRSIWVFLAFLLFYPFYRAHRKKKFISKRQQILCREFKDGIQSVAAALTAGYSIENSFREAYQEMRLQYGNQGYMTRELRYITSSISLNVPIEQLLQDFANRSGLEDVQSFCEVFTFAKRSGGDFIQIIHLTATRIIEKNELMEEIQTAISGKRMEQKVMNLMPMFILAYVGFSFGDYLDVLYHNVIGISVMTACLFMYLGSYLLSEKIIDIQV